MEGMVLVNPRMVTLVLAHRLGSRIVIKTVIAVSDSRGAGAVGVTIVMFGMCAMIVIATEVESGMVTGRKRMIAKMIAIVIGDREIESVMAAATATVAATDGMTGGMTDAMTDGIGLVAGTAVAVTGGMTDGTDRGTVAGIGETTAGMIVDQGPDGLGIVIDLGIVAIAATNMVLPEIESKIRHGRSSVLLNRTILTLTGNIRKPINLFPPGPGPLARAWGPVLVENSSDVCSSWA